MKRVHYLLIYLGLTAPLGGMAEDKPILGDSVENNQAIWDELATPPHPHERWPEPAPKAYWDNPYPPGRWTAPPPPVFDNPYPPGRWLPPPPGAQWLPPPPSYHYWSPGPQYRPWQPVTPSELSEER